MKYRFCFLILFLLSVNCCLAQEPQASMMSGVDNAFLDKLIAAAKMNYPKMKVSESTVNIAKLNLQKSKMDWLNIFTFTYLYSPSGTASLLAGSGGTTGSNSFLLNGYQLGVGVSAGAIVERPNMIKTAKEQYKIAQLNFDEYNLNIETVVKQRYYTYIQQQTVLSWRMKTLDGAEATLKEVKSKFEKGLLPFDDYNRALTLYSSTVQSKIENESAYLIAKSNLEEIIGAKLESIK